MNLSFIVVLAIFILFILVLLMISDTRRKLSRVQFLKLSEKLKLECVAPTGFLAKFPELSGDYNGFPVHIYMFTEQIGEGKSRTIRIHTAIEVKIKNPLGYQLDIYEEGFFSKIYKVFGMQDIVIGNEKFDKEYIIKSNNEEITKEILTKHICDELLFLADNKFAFGFEVKNNMIYYDESTSITNEKKAMWFQRILTMMIELASEVEKKNDPTYN